MNFHIDKFMRCSRCARILKFVDFFECSTIAAVREADIIRFTASMDIIQDIFHPNFQ